MELVLYVGDGRFGDLLLVDEGGVEDEDRDVEVAARRLVPFDRGVADVVAGQQEVGSRQAHDRAAPGGHLADVGARVGAEVGRVAEPLGRLLEPDGHLLGRGHGRVVLRVDRDDPRGVEELHRGSAGHPGDGLLIEARVFGREVVGGHEGLHPLEGPYPPVLGLAARIGRALFARGIIRGITH